MTVPNIFGTQPAGNVPASYLDVDFAYLLNSVLPSVLNYGATGNGSTDDSAAFTAAFAANDSVFVPVGTYNVGGVVMAAQKKLIGENKFTTILKPLTPPADFILSVDDACQVSGIYLHGNNITPKGIKIIGDYTVIDNVKITNCTHAFHYSAADVATLTNCNTDHNTFGIYTDDRFINCVIDNFVSAGSDTTGIFMTYSTTQPQAVRITNSLFFGNTNAIVVDKDIFVFDITNTAVDGGPDSAVVLGNSVVTTGGMANININSCFLDGHVSVIDIAAGSNSVEITGTTIGNGVTGIKVRADATHRCTGIVVRDSIINNNSGVGIAFDSVIGGLVDGCVFSTAGGALDFQATSTFVGADYNTIISNCTFNKSNSVDLTFAAVINPTGSGAMGAAVQSGFFQNLGATQLGTGSADYIQVEGSGAGAPAIGGTGSSTDCSPVIWAKGAGSVIFNSNGRAGTQIGLMTPTGFKSSLNIRQNTPATETGASRTVLSTDNCIIANRAGTVTLTLPDALAYSGRTIRIVTIQAQAVVSDSSNVVPLAGGSAGTAILAATAGKWADLWSDSSNWIITASN
jgi:hypothetical protein